MIVDIFDNATDEVEGLTRRALYFWLDQMLGAVIEWRNFLAESEQKIAQLEHHVERLQRSL